MEAQLRRMELRRSDDHPRISLAFLLLATTALTEAFQAATHARLVPHRSAPPQLCATDARSLCTALSDGSAADGLSSTLSSAKTARGFLHEWLSNDEYSCANSAEVPAALADALAVAPLAVLDVILLQLVMGNAASSSGTASTRAVVLLNRLWGRVPELQLSCAALTTVVAEKLGQTIPVTWDGNYEYLREDWAGVLAFTSYTPEELGRVSQALELIGGAESSGE